MSRLRRGDGSARGEAAEHGGGDQERLAHGHDPFLRGCDSFHDDLADHAGLAMTGDQAGEFELARAW